MTDHERHSDRRADRARDIALFRYALIDAAGSRSLVGSSVWSGSKRRYDTAPS